MRITATDGIDYEHPDMCPYCNITTGGQHQWNCPAFPPFRKLYEVGVDISKIRILKCDDEGNFIKEIK